MPRAHGAFPPQRHQRLGRPDGRLRKTGWPGFIEVLRLHLRHHAGENWTVEAGETLFGEVVGVRQDEEQRYVLLHIGGDVPDVGLFGIHRMGESITLSVCCFFYRPKAAETAAASEPKRRAWLDGVAKP